MALPTVSKLLELEDVKIAPLTDDPEGGSATYGTLVDIPGIVKLGIKPVVEKKELQGDNQVMDIWTKVKAIEINFEHVKLSLDVLKIMLGGTVTATGESPNQIQTYSLTADDKPGYFKLEGRVVYVEEGLGDVHFVTYKCLADDPPSWEVSDQSGDFATVSGKATAIPRKADGKIFDIIFNESAEPIS